MMMYLIAAIVVLCLVIALVVLLPSSDKKQKKDAQYRFELFADGGRRITFGNPFNGFLVYGGAESGKTKSIGKPLLEQFVKNRFAGFIYDYKDFDLTRTAYNLVKKNQYPYKFYYISFVDMERTHRTNPIVPAVVGNESLFLQLISDLLTAYMEKDSKKDEWFGGALGIMWGVSIRFYRDFPKLCTIPHIVNYVCSAGTQRITEFLNGSHESRALAKGFLDAADSPKTQASYLSSLTRNLGILANNKEISYVLTGNDFQYNLLDPEDPKLVAVANSFQIESLISPIISLMLSISSRRFTMANKIPFVYVLDEATTFRIADFEKMPSVLREYLCAFLVLTQSSAKIEKLYGKYDRSSLESNFGNVFFGRTKDVEALKSYPLVFGKHEKQKISRTSGSVIKLVTLQEMQLPNGLLLDKGTALFGTVKLDQDRINIAIESVRVGNSIYELKKTVYDQDGLPGIYVPLNIKAEASKEAADEVVGDLNTGIYGTDVLSTGVNAVSNAAKSVFRKKNNQIVVTVKSNYKLYLK